MFYLRLAKDVRQFEFLAWIKRAGYHIRHPQNVFVEKATGLSYHPAFVIAGAKLFLNKIEVPDNVLLV